MSTIDQYIQYEKAIKWACEFLPETSSSDFKPELSHSLGTGFRLLQFGYSGDVVIAGFLHEFMEETDISKDDIEKEFGAHVANIVEANTKNTVFEDPMEKARDIASRCQAVGDDALAVKAANIIDNFEYFKRVGNKKEMEIDAAWGRIVLEYIKNENELFRAVSSL